MKRIGFLFLSISLWSAPVHAGKNPFSEGVKAHSEKNYQLAAQKFTEAISANENNASAYYNLGLAEMGNQRYGAAIWAFEKVVKFDPNDGEALSKLERCQEELNPEVSYNPVLSGLESTLYGISSDTWALLVIASSVLLSLCIILFKIKRHPSMRRVFLITGFFAFIVLAFSMWTASATSDYYGNEQYGIVVQAMIPTYLDDENLDKTELKEGTRVLLMDSEEKLLVRVKDLMGHEYLVKQSDLRYF